MVSGTQRRKKPENPCNPGAGCSYEELQEAVVTVEVGKEQRQLAKGSFMRRTGLTLATVALFLYGPGILMPALHVEKLGSTRESCILDSFTMLLNEGEIFLGAIVGLSAVVLPPVKLTLLLWLGGAAGDAAVRGWRARVLELIGRFGCLEVFLAAVLVTLVRLNALVSFQVLPGMYFFATSAILGLAASGALFLGCNVKEAAHDSHPCAA
jgi:uncharacterized paraquat-inducible protein A